MDLDNIDKFLDVRSPEKLTQNLRRIFSKLLDPDEDPTFMLKYMVMFLCFIPQHFRFIAVVIRTPSKRGWR